MTNPFKPSAGSSPPLLVGRQAALSAFEESLDDGPGAPARLSRLTGARGVGKTVMLTALGERAQAQGWIVVAETATAGLVDRLTHAVERQLQAIAGEPKRGVSAFTSPSVLGVSLGGVTLGAKAPPPDSDFRTAASALLDELEPRETGLLITVDEIHRSAIEEMRALATAYQHLVRDGRNVALSLAGLPSSVSDLLNDKVLTFLRRAVPFELNDIPLGEVEDALLTTITQGGRTIDPAALTEATRATSGYPFMIQLVGYHIWRLAEHDHIGLAAAQRGIDAARVRLGSTVHETALADLSGVDRTYLLAMAQDAGPSSTGEIAQRIGRGAAHANMYRTRLIQAGIIVATGYGYVDFAIPFLREYLREHAASIEMRSRPTVT